uniref:Serine-threonine/tyrosine-protein kinase catalytic domain-containing protein n=1 Tax=Aegilops tauschii subsp. strangulata TaxID=200361 RepID=A0A453DGH4_AEGTS
YAWHGQLTKKADIYSFGVLVIEIVSGKSGSRSLLADDKFLLEKQGSSRNWLIQTLGITLMRRPSGSSRWPSSARRRRRRGALRCCRW